MAQKQIMSREEMETIIIGNADSNKWEVCSADPKMIRKLERQGYKPNGQKNPWGYQSFTLDLAKISFRGANIAKRRGPEYPAFLKRQGPVAISGT